MCEGVFKLVYVEDDADGASAERGELAEHDVAADAFEVVCLGKGGGLHELCGGLLEGCAHEGPGGAAPVDAVAGDGDEAACLSHGVREDADVAVIDVRVVEGEDLAELVEEGGARALDAQHVVDGEHVVRRCPRKVYHRVCKQLRKVCS